MTYKKLLSLSLLSVLTVIPVLTLSACNGSGLNLNNSKPKIENAKYWQRSSASSALHLQGPKAQQILHADIATCVNEISELEKLGEIRRAVPANYNSGNVIEHRSASQQKLDQYDTPQRDGFLYSEHLDYHDFETCMNAKGWERLEHLPYQEADLARKNYLERYGKKSKNNLGGRENVTTLHKTSTNFPTQIGVNE